jgi:hypothetical protein
MLYIDSAPPKSVDRTYIYETVTILRSEGLVNLERRRRRLNGSLQATIAESKHADCDQARSLSPRLPWPGSPPWEPSTHADPGESERICVAAFQCPSSSTE